MNRSYVLVVNLHSRKARDAVSQIKQTFKTKKLDLEVVEVKDTNKINTAFARALKLNPSVIVIGGGDGTLISGIEYLTCHGYKKPIGLLPLGTSNNLAKNLSLPIDVDGAIDILIRGKSKSIPVGVANGKFFALSVLIGLTQAAAEQVTDKSKQKWGQMAYLMEILRQTKHHEHFKYKIVTPDLKKPITGTTHQIMVYNTDLNQTLKILPEHSIKKHSLKVVINRCGASKMKFYLSFLIHTVSFGKLRPYMRVFELSSLEVSTAPALGADYDGEPYGKSPYSISLYKNDIKVIC